MKNTIQTSQPIMTDNLKTTGNIAAFWDKISEAWREIWGPHIHHGYYENNSTGHFTTI